MPHIDLRYRWSLECLLKCRAVIGGGTAACVLWSLELVRMHMLCRHHSSSILSAVPYCICITFLVCSGIATWSMGCRIPSRDFLLWWQRLYNVLFQVSSAICCIVWLCDWRRRVGLKITNNIDISVDLFQVYDQTESVLHITDIQIYNYRCL